MSKPHATVEFRWLPALGRDVEHIASLLKTFGDLLPDPLSGRMDLTLYAKKLVEKAEIGCVYSNSQAVAFLAMYANDHQSGVAHIPILAVEPKLHGQRLGTLLMRRAISKARENGMLSLTLKVKSDNIMALKLYRTHGMRPVGKEEQKLLMSVDIDT